MRTVRFTRVSAVLIIALQLSLLESSQLRRDFSAATGISPRRLHDAGKGDLVDVPLSTIGGQIPSLSRLSDSNVAATIAWDLRLGEPKVQ